MLCSSSEESGKRERRNKRRKNRILSIIEIEILKEARVWIRAQKHIIVTKIAITSMKHLIIKLELPLDIKLSLVGNNKVMKIKKSKVTLKRPGKHWHLYPRSICNLSSVKLPETIQLFNKLIRNYGLGMIIYLRSHVNQNKRLLKITLWKAIWWRRYKRWSYFRKQLIQKDIMWLTLLSQAYI